MSGLQRADRLRPSCRIKEATAIDHEGHDFQPGLSLAERDRRWQALRSIMERERVDCAVCPGADSTETRAGSRYLTHCGGGDAEIACVFPLNGEVAAIAPHRDRRRWAQAWVTDLREARPANGKATADKLREIALPHQRVGIVGLESLVTPGLLAILHEAFPRVQWVDFTRQVRELRAVKSDEEIALLTRTTELVDSAFSKVVEVARPGVKDYEAWSAAIGEICKSGSELPVSSLWGSGARPTLAARPTHGALQYGHLIVAEMEANIGGYRARGVQPIAVGACDPALRELHEMHAEYWQRCLESLAVGGTIEELDALCQQIAEKVVPEGGRFEKVQGTLAMRGAGLGSDTPKGKRGQGSQHGVEPINAGWAFLFKPLLSVEVKGRSYSASWGDTVAMERSGARRLGSRTPGLMVAGA